MSPPEDEPDDRLQNARALPAGSGVCLQNNVCVMADVTGDRRADAIAFQRY